MSADATVTYRRENGIAFLSFDGQTIGADAFPALQYAISDHCDQIASTPGIRICVIDGLNGEPFTQLTSSVEGLDHWRQCVSGRTSMIDSVSRLDIPVIIAMNGTITGPGLELALACDVRLATPASRFGCPHVTMGRFPFEGGTQRLPRIIGSGKALEMLLTGSLMDAQTAWQSGLIHYLYDENELKPKVQSMARKMDEKSPISLMYVKEAVRSGMEMSLKQGLRLEANLYFLMHTTEDRKEGIRAFKEKRKPLFKGR